MKKMTRKNYTADIEYGDEDKCFVGHIAGISAIIGFHGDNVAELRSAFEEAADDYLDNCAEEGKATTDSDEIAGRYTKPAGLLAAREKTVFLAGKAGRGP